MIKVEHRHSVDPLEDVNITPGQQQMHHLLNT